MSRTFNGSISDLITIPGISNGIDITADQMTMALWLKVPIVPVSEVDALTKWNVSNVGGYLVTISEAGHSKRIGIAFYESIPLNHFIDLYGTSDVLANTWYSVVGIYHNNDFSSLYINGVLVASGGSGSTGTMVASGTNLLLGSKRPSAANFFAGDVGSVAIWDKKLSDGEAVSLGLGVSPNKVRRSSLKGYWPLWGAGSPEPDLSGNGLNGVLTGTTVSNQPPMGAFA